MKITEKSKSKNNKTDNPTPNKNTSAKNLTPTKEINKTHQKSIERMNQSPQRRKISGDPNKSHDFGVYVDAVTEDLNHKKQKM